MLAAVDSLVKDAWPNSPALHDPASAHAAAHAPHPAVESTPDAAYLSALSAVQAALGGSAAGVLRPRGSSPSGAPAAPSRAPHHHAHHRPQPRSASSSSSAAATTFHDDYSTSATSSAAPSFRLDPATGDMIASLPLSLSDLASLPSHSGLAALGDLDPAQIPPDGILADHLPLDLSGPASLPSLMGAIAELEQCVARLSLEANEARTLQKTLRLEMAARTAGRGRGGAAGAGAGAGGGPGAARAAAKKQRRKAKKRAAAEAEASAAAAAAAAASSGSPHAREHGDDDELDDEHAQAPLTRDEALVSGLSGRADDCCSECGESHAAAPPSHAPAPASSVIAGSAHRALGVGAWEDGELMKALQSVSQLDRRADEYRERLRVLKVRLPLSLSLSRSRSPLRSRARSSSRRRRADAFRSHARRSKSTITPRSPTRSPPRLRRPTATRTARAAHSCRAASQARVSPRACGPSMRRARATCTSSTRRKRRRRRSCRTTATSRAC